MTNVTQQVRPPFEVAAAHLDWTGKPVVEEVDEALKGAILQEKASGRLVVSPTIEGNIVEEGASGELRSPKKVNGAEVGALEGAFLEDNGGEELDEESVELLQMTAAKDDGNSHFIVGQGVEPKLTRDVNVLHGPSLEEESEGFPRCEMTFHRLRPLYDPAVSPAPALHGPRWASARLTA